MNGPAFLKHYLKGYLPQLFIIVFCVIFYVVLMLLSPLIFRFIIDHLIQQLPISNPFLLWCTDLLGGVEYLRNNLWVGFLVIIFLNVFIGIFNFLKGRYNAIVAERVTENIRNDLFRKLQYLPFSFHQDNKSGELIQKCTSDVDQIRRFIASHISEMTYSIAMSIIAFTILFNINANLALYCTISMPLLLIVALWFFKKMNKVFLASDESEGALMDVLQENLLGIRVVKAFNKEKFETDRFAQFNQDFTDKTFKVIKLIGAYWSLTDALCLIQILVAIVLGIYSIQNGIITSGDFFVFLTYELIILWPIRMLGRIIADMGKMFVSAKRLADIMNNLEEELDNGDEPNLNGDIVFSNVSFGFPDSTQHALTDVCLSIPANKTTAIMGPIGSGKSTLVHLLCRLYEASAGEITINGISTLNISKGYLRKNIGIVLQEPFLFSKTIKDNIKISTPFANESMISSAANIASVHEVISAFDQGYETMVGERGVTLSGGQKQRIAIARVIINDVKVLVFDDSLSAVDSETDLKIRNALSDLAQGLTTIIITHRFESAMHANQIVIMEEGRISQIGKHKELIKRKGFYQQIYRLQRYQGAIKE